MTSVRFGVHTLTSIVFIISLCKIFYLTPSMLKRWSVRNLRVSYFLFKWTELVHLASAYDGLKYYFNFQMLFERTYN